MRVAGVPGNREYTPPAPPFAVAPPNDAFWLTLVNGCGGGLLAFCAGFVVHSRVDGLRCVRATFWGAPGLFLLRRNTLPNVLPTPV